MTDKQDSNDEIQSISRKLQSITTAEAVVSSPVDATRTCQIVVNRDLPSNPKMNNSTSSHSIPDGKKSLPADDNSPVRNLPELNLPEKIVFVIDTTKEHDCTQFKLGTGAKYSPLFMIKRVVEIFVSAKSKIQREHEFALMTLDAQSAQWLCNFTSNIKTILNHLDTLTEKSLDEEQKTFDLTKVFEMLHANVPLLSGTDPKNPPQFVTRVILIYSRSHCIPKFQSGQNEFELLMEIPYFFLDSLLVHEPPSTENKCEEVYAELTALDAKNFSYILEVGRNATKLHDNMAKLLAHPLQRPVQKNACYTFGTLTMPQDLHTTKEFRLLMEITYFFVDSLLMHQPTSAENKCEEVRAELTALGAMSFSYILEVGRSATKLRNNMAKLHNNMAKLLVHPLQRPVQINACYTFGTLTMPQDLHNAV